MAMAPNPSNRTEHILIVDDEPSIRRVLRVLLELEGFQVSEAENGLLALQWLERETPDLVVLDVMMPEMDGFEVCQKVRQKRRFAQLPVVFLTAKEAFQSRIMSLDKGANDYVTKPYNQKELVLRIRNLLKLSRAGRDSNPLTGLPGNAAIEAETQARLDGQVDFALLYLDLDFFKAFNDSYSYRAGDRVIRLLAEILNEAMDRLGNAGDFVGHIGGDDFVALTTPGRADAICTYVIDQFDRRIRDHYRPEDRERGYVEVENRRFQMERFPLVSVTIALVESARYRIDHLAVLNDVVAELKKQGKQIPGSVVARDQRTVGESLRRTGSDG